MSAFAIGSVLRNEVVKGVRIVVAEITGTASYDTNGSSLALSSYFSSKVYGGKVLSVSAHASDRYSLSVVKASSYGLSPTIKVRDLAAVTPGSEASSTTDLSAITWVMEFVGV